ncbi:hypothetical protein ACFV1L_11655 [Kitasatospora sp. NPDC059646]|uniref:hypothetical protein n=1 Tax=Kitasatospora sp. NPDC059646 TaxID=3346893 RepID=UPI0036B9B2EF
MTAADQPDTVHLTRLRDLTAQEHKLAVLVATGIGPAASPPRRRPFQRPALRLDGRRGRPRQRPDRH